MSFSHKKIKNKKQHQMNKNIITDKDSFSITKLMLRFAEVVKLYEIMYLYVLKK